MDDGEWTWTGGVPPEAGGARVGKEHAREQAQRCVPGAQRAQGAAGPVGLAEEAHMRRGGEAQRPVAIAVTIVVDSPRRRRVGVGHGRGRQMRRSVHEESTAAVRMCRA